MAFTFKTSQTAADWYAVFNPLQGAPRTVPVSMFLVYEDAALPPADRLKIVALVWNQAAGNWADPTAHPRFVGFTREGLNSASVAVPT